MINEYIMHDVLPPRAPRCTCPGCCCRRGRCESPGCRHPDSKECRQDSRDSKRSPGTQSVLQKPRTGDLALRLSLWWSASHKRGTPWWQAWAQAQGQPSAAPGSYSPSGSVAPWCETCCIFCENNIRWARAADTLQDLSIAYLRDFLLNEIYFCKENHS